MGKRKTAAPVVEAPPAETPEVEEQRAPDGEPQMIALAEAEAAGVLPEEDRREPMPEAVVIDGAVVEVEPEAIAVPEPVAAPVAREPYTGQRFRTHDPERPGVVCWEDEAGNLLS